MLRRVNYHHLTASVSLIKVGRSKDTTLKTSGSAVQTTGVESHNAIEDRHVSYKLQEKGYSDTTGVLHLKICQKGLQSLFPWTGSWRVHRERPQPGRGVKAESPFLGSSCCENTCSTSFNAHEKYATSPQRFQSRHQRDRLWDEQGWRLWSKQHSTPPPAEPRIFDAQPWSSLEWGQCVYALWRSQWGEEGRS